MCIFPHFSKVLTTKMTQITSYYGKWLFIVKICCCVAAVRKFFITSLCVAWLVLSSVA